MKHVFSSIVGFTIVAAITSGFQAGYNYYKTLPEPTLSGPAAQIIRSLRYEDGWERSRERSGSESEQTVIVNDTTKVIPGWWSATVYTRPKAKTLKDGYHSSSREPWFQCKYLSSYESKAINKACDEFLKRAEARELSQ